MRGSIHICSYRFIQNTEGHNQDLTQRGEQNLEAVSVLVGLSQGERP